MLLLNASCVVPYHTEWLQSTEGWHILFYFSPRQEFLVSILSIYLYLLLYLITIQKGRVASNRER